MRDHFKDRSAKPSDYMGTLTIWSKEKLSLSNGRSTQNSFSDNHGHRRCHLVVLLQPFPSVALIVVSQKFGRKQLTVKKMWENDPICVFDPSAAALDGPKLIPADGWCWWLTADFQTDTLSIAYITYISWNLQNSHPHRRVWKITGISPFLLRMANWSRFWSRTAALTWSPHDSLRRTLLCLVFSQQLVSGRIASLQKQSHLCCVTFPKTGAACV